MKLYFISITLFVKARVHTALKGLNLTMVIMSYPSPRPTSGNGNATMAVLSK